MIDAEYQIPKQDLGILRPLDRYISVEEHSIQCEILISRGKAPRENIVDANWDIDDALSDSNP